MEKMNIMNMKRNIKLLIKKQVILNNENRTYEKYYLNFKFINK